MKIEVQSSSVFYNKKIFIGYLNINKKGGYDKNPIYLSYKKNENSIYKFKFLWGKKWR